MDLDAPPRPPSLTEFGPDVRVLAGIYDRLGELIATTRAAAGDKKARSPRPWPRPRLAAERMKRRRALAKHEHLTRQLIADR